MCVWRWFYEMVVGQKLLIISNRLAPLSLISHSRGLRFVRDSFYFLSSLLSSNVAHFFSSPTLRFPSWVTLLDSYPFCIREFGISSASQMTVCVGLVYCVDYFFIGIGLKVMIERERKTGYDRMQATRNSPIKSSMYKKREWIANSYSTHTHTHSPKNSSLLRNARHSNDARQFQLLDLIKLDFHLLFLIHFLSLLLHTWTSREREREESQPDDELRNERKSLYEKK